MIELTNPKNNLKLEQKAYDANKATMVAFTVQGKKMIHYVGILSYYGELNHPLNSTASVKVTDPAIPESLTQISETLIAVSTIQSLQVIDVVSCSSIFRIPTPSSFTKLIPVHSPLNLV